MWELSNIPGSARCIDACGQRHIRWIARLALSVAAASFLLVRSGVLLAQEEGGVPDPSAGAGEATRVVVSQPFPYGGLFVLILMAGLSLFAVCRSSRRN